MRLFTEKSPPAGAHFQARNEEYDYEPLTNYQQTNDQ
jgi:hypothetical protein